MLRALPATAAACALLLASCGGEEEPPPPKLSADAMLDRAFERLPTSGVAAIDLEARRPQSSEEAVSAQLEGSFARGADPLPSFDLEGEAEASGFGVELSIVSTGDDAFVVFFGENYRVGRERVSALARQSSLDPRSWLGPAKHAGADEVDGVDTYTIEAPLTDQLSADIERLGAASLGLEGSVEGMALVGVGADDGVIRRLEVASDALDLDLSPSDLGEPQEINPPPGGGFQPIDDLLERIPGL